jgi:hypothetical protein
MRVADNDEAAGGHFSTFLGTTPIKDVMRK